MDDDDFEYTSLSHSSGTASLLHFPWSYFRSYARLFKDGV